MFFTATLLIVSMATCLLAGVFLAFSDFLMRSFDKTTDGSGTEAMQVLNREIYRSVFMFLFLGMVAVSVVSMVYGFLWAPGPAGAFLASAGLIYVCSVFGVTAFGNVPLNNRLDALPLGGALAQSFWPEYLLRWTRLNHVRALACLASALCYAWAAVLHAAA